jgi:hypothetical protein
MLLHLCRCGQAIPQGVDMCDSCRAKYGSRHMIYNRQQRSQQAADFYRSRAWRIMRARMIDVFDRIDVLAYYTEGAILAPTMVHHLVELEDDWDRRMDPFNLIPLAGSTHARVTARYKASKASMEACQAELIECRRRWFADRGGVEKVLCDAFLVAPPSSSEKIPH